MIAVALGFLLWSAPVLLCAGLFANIFVQGLKADSAGADAWDGALRHDPTKWLGLVNLIAIAGLLGVGFLPQDIQTEAVARWHAVSGTQGDTVWPGFYGFFNQIRALVDSPPVLVFLLVLGGGWLASIGAFVAWIVGGQTLMKAGYASKWGAYWSGCGLVVVTPILAVVAYVATRMIMTQMGFKP